MNPGMNDHLHADIRDGVRALCAALLPEHHRRIDAERGHPEAFVDALTQAGWLAALIPQACGGSGIGLAEASVIMEELNRSGANAGACHGQMHNMGTLLRHGSAAQKAAWLPKIARGDLRLQSMGVTDPGTGTGTSKTKTTAVRTHGGRRDRWVVNGLNAERKRIAAECIGDGRWFVDKVTACAEERVVFGRPIGQNQGVQFPIAEAHIDTGAADLMRWQACHRFDAMQPCVAQANMARLLAAKASWETANAAIQFHGGFGFACEYGVERKFRQTRPYQVAPVSTNLILAYVAEHVLGLPRSF